VLWRDSATILIGIVLALLVVRFLLPSGPATAIGSPSPEDTGLVAVASATLPPTPGDTPAPTLGNVVPPSLHLEATPTPIPVITLPPATPRPQPTPTLQPGQTPGPTASPKSTLRPTPTPPPVVVSFHCDQSGLTLTCHDLSLYETQPTKRLWTFVQSGYSTATSRTNPAAHTFAAPGDVTVTLTVYGYNGSTSHDNFLYTLTGP
jgi:PKD repeat protein